MTSGRRAGRECLYWRFVHGIRWDLGGIQLSASAASHGRFLAARPCVGEQQSPNDVFGEIGSVDPEIRCRSWKSEGSSGREPTLLGHTKRRRNRGSLSQQWLQRLV